MGTLNSGLDMPKNDRADLDLFTPHEAAEVLLTNHRTMERWRTEGTGPVFVKIGRRVAYQRADLEQFVRERRAKHTAETR